ncbi:hypothetical protein FRC11_010413 [Ceratobasidium sp. 423]|nr:hypothetical protein FRC11_010413 [Ceratobasidium sp. 423]
MLTSAIVVLLAGGGKGALRVFMSVVLVRQSTRPIILPTLTPRSVDESQTSKEPDAQFSRRLVQLSDTGIRPQVNAWIAMPKPNSELATTAPPTLATILILSLDSSESLACIQGLIALIEIIPPTRPSRRGTARQPQLVPKIVLLELINLPRNQGKKDWAGGFLLIQQ